MNCKICGVPLDLEPLAVDDERQVHTACIELEQDRISDDEMKATYLLDSSGEEI